MPCSECHKCAGAYFLVGGRNLCGECYERLYPERVPKFDQEAINKRVMEKKWVRMVDLPGYKEWSQQFKGLEKIIHDLVEYHVLVHPVEFDHSLNWLFEREFKGALEDRNLRVEGSPVRLEDYRIAQSE